MSYSLPKGRNYSKENLVDKKYYGARHSEKANLLSVLSSVGNLQDRNNAKTLKYILALIQVEGKAKMCSLKGMSPVRCSNP